MTMTKKLMIATAVSWAVVWGTMEAQAGFSDRAAEDPEGFQEYYRNAAEEFAMKWRQKIDDRTQPDDEPPPDDTWEHDGYTHWTGAGVNPIPREYHYPEHGYYKGWETFKSPNGSKGWAHPRSRKVFPTMELACLDNADWHDQNGTPTKEWTGHVGGANMESRTHGWIREYGDRENRAIIGWQGFEALYNKVRCYAKTDLVLGGWLGYSRLDEVQSTNYWPSCDRYNKNQVADLTTVEPVNENEITWLTAMVDFGDCSYADDGTRYTCEQGSLPDGKFDMVGMINNMSECKPYYENGQRHFDEDGYPTYHCKFKLHWQDINDELTGFNYRPGGTVSYKILDAEDNDMKEAGCVIFADET